MSFLSRVVLQMGINMKRTIKLFVNFMGFSALFCVVYLRRIANGQECVSCIQGKVNVTLVNQVNWVIARKKLEAAKMCAELMLQVSNSLRHLACGLHFWSNSQVVSKWILNPDLDLPRCAKRRVDRMHLTAPANAWKYANTTLNPADVGTRWENVKNAGILTWLDGPSFLLHVGMEPSTSDDIVVKNTGITADPPAFGLR